MSLTEALQAPGDVSPSKTARHIIPANRRRGAFLGASLADQRSTAHAPSPLWSTGRGRHLAESLRRQLLDTAAHLRLVAGTSQSGDPWPSSRPWMGERRYVSCGAASSCPPARLLPFNIASQVPRMTATNIDEDAPGWSPAHNVTAFPRRPEKQQPIQPLSTRSLHREHFTHPEPYLRSCRQWLPRAA